MVEFAWQDRTLGTLVAKRAAEYGDRTFLYFRDREISFRELDQKSNAVANNLARLGIGHGDKVAIMMPNCPEFYHLWFGLAKIGAIEVPINTAYRGDLLGYVIDQSDSRWIAIQDGLADRLGLIQERLGKVERILIHSESGAMPSLNLTQPTMPLGELLEGLKDYPSASVKPSDIYSLQYTSGTTGVSKGAMTPHAFAFALIPVHLEACKYTADDVLYTCLPLFHGNAQVLSTVVALVAGARLVLGERFHASTFWDDMRRYGVTAFNYIGGLLTLLYKQPENPKDRDNPVRVAFGAAAPLNLWVAIEERFGIELIEGFGLTESGAILCNYGANRKIGSIGRPHAIYDVAILDEEDQPLGPDHIGEIVGRPRVPYSMTLGYHRMPEKTVETFRNCWFHTGDLGYYDQDGYFYYVDRKKDAIRRRGENISSFEVEKVINAHPKVLESAALAHPSEIGEDEVRAVVVLKEAETMTPEELVGWCEERMAYFMVPRFVEFRSSMPKTPTDRVEKYKLREEGLGPDAWDREKAGYKVKR